MTAFPRELIRADLRSFAGYSSARTSAPDSSAQEPRIWLNANESAWDNPADEDGALRRYPDPQPQRLRAALAGLYGSRPEQLLACRGSDEAIDLLVRTLCAPGGDAVAITPPTFGMYAVSARLHGTRVVEVAQREEERGLVVDTGAVAEAALAEGVRIVFLASPGNPTGTLVGLDQVHTLAERLAGQALVVIDEAYLEFAGAPSAASLLDQVPNVAVLRTLSKAHALAGARIGTVIAHPDLIAVLQRCQAPYPLPAPSVELACAALDAQALSRTTAQVADVVQGRARLGEILASAPTTTRVYPSTANFVLARFSNPQQAFEALLAAGVVVRDMRDKPGLSDALRITVGTSAELDVVEQVLSRMPAPRPVTADPTPTIRTDLETTP